MWTVAPQVKTIQQPIQFLNRQHNDFVGEIWRCFETFRLQALEPKTKAVALPVQFRRNIEQMEEPAITRTAWSPKTSTTQLSICTYSFNTRINELQNSGRLSCMISFPTDRCQARL